MRSLVAVVAVCAWDAVWLVASFDAGAVASAISVVGGAIVGVTYLWRRERARDQRERDQIEADGMKLKAAAHREWLDANKPDLLAKIDANTAEIARLSVESEECKEDRAGLRGQLHEITQAVLRERGFVTETTTLRVDAPGPAPGGTPPC